MLKKVFNESFAHICLMSWWIASKKFLCFCYVLKDQIFIRMLHKSFHVIMQCFVSISCGTMLMSIYCEVSEKFSFLLWNCNTMHLFWVDNLNWNSLLSNFLKSLVKTFQFCILCPWEVLSGFCSGNQCRTPQGWVVNQYFVFCHTPW